MLKMRMNAGGVLGVGNDVSVRHMCMHVHMTIPVWNEVLSE